MDAFAQWRTVDDLQNELKRLGFGGLARIEIMRLMCEAWEAGRQAQREPTPEHWLDVTEECILADALHVTVDHTEIGTVIHFPDGKLDDSHKLCVIPAGYRLSKVCIPPTHYTESGFAEPKPKYAFIVEQRQSEERG